MANLPADLPTNWEQGQIITPNGTEVGLTQQYGYNYLNGQVNATETEVNNLSSEVSSLSIAVAGAASQTSVDNIASTIGTTTDTGATSTAGTLMGKANYLIDNSGAVKSRQEIIISQQELSSTDTNFNRATGVGAYYYDYTIQAVDIEKSMIIASTAAVEDSYNPCARFVNSNTVRVYTTFISGDSYIIGAYIQVIEFY